MIVLYALNNDVTYVDSFGVEPVPKETKIFIDESIVATNVFRIQSYGSAMYG